MQFTVPFFISTTLKQLQHTRHDFENTIHVKLYCKALQNLKYNLG